MKPNFLLFFPFVPVCIACSCHPYQARDSMNLSEATKLLTGRVSPASEKKAKTFTALPNHTLFSLPALSPSPEPVACYGDGGTSCRERRCPGAGCRPLPVPPAPNHLSMPPRQLVTSPRSRPVTTQLGEAQILTFLRDLEAFPSGIHSRLVPALVQRLFPTSCSSFSQDLPASTTAALQNTQLGCGSPSPEATSALTV